MSTKENALSGKEAPRPPLDTSEAPPSLSAALATNPSPQTKRPGTIGGRRRVRPPDGSASTAPVSRPSEGASATRKPTKGGTCTPLASPPPCWVTRHPASGAEGGKAGRRWGRRPVGWTVGGSGGYADQDWHHKGDQPGGYDLLPGAPGKELAACSDVPRVSCHRSQTRSPAPPPPPPPNARSSCRTSRSSSGAWLRLPL